MVLLALTWGRLSRAALGWAALTCAGMVLEFAAMFWSHVYLTAWPLFLDPYDFNRQTQVDHRLVFLADRFRARPAVVLATVVVQLALVVLLARWLAAAGPARTGKGERLQNDRDRV